MIKRIILILLLIIAPRLAYANIFSDALHFVCGGGTVTETWSGSSKNYDEDKLCPPYNKFGNRGGCLKQFDAPKLGTLFYFKYCAEEAPSSSYFSPKIQVRMQSCNSLLLTCWALSTELSWDGECVQWPTPTLFPLQRLCARMAAPADNTATPATPADEGYTYFKHLNFEGATVDDQRIPGTDGQSTFIISPKTCAYWDPWAFDLFPIMPITYIPLFDIFDYNPIKQPFHHNSGVHPIVQMMISFIEAGLNSSQMILQMISYIQEAAGGPIGMLMGFIGDKTGLTKMIIDMVTKCIKLVGEDVFIKILKEFGQLNHVVYENLGCVSVPMGPFPPPYPPQYTSAPPSPIIEAVCATTADYTITVTNSAGVVTSAPVVASAPPIPPSGATNVSTNTVNGITTSIFIDTAGNKTTSVSPSFIASNSSKKCATSMLSNNAINNVVRVGIDQILPRCDLATLSSSASSSATTSTTTVAKNSCVTLNGSLSAQATSGATGISSSNITTPNVSPPSVCGGTVSPCGYRVVYATQYVASAPPLLNPYYDPTIPDCTGGVYPCQLIWGINAGPYIDIALTFPAIETKDVSNTLISDNPTSPATAFTYNSQSYKFMTAISRTSTAPISSDNLSYYNSVTNSYTPVSASNVGVSSQDPTKICVYIPTDASVALAQGASSSPDWTLSTCLTRATAPAPTTIACGSSGVLSCTSSNFAPQMVVALNVGSYSTQGVLAANAFAASSSALTSINLAGYEYTATVTDDTFIVPPFPAIANTTHNTRARSCGNISNFAASFASMDYTAFSYTPNANNGSLFGTYNPAPNDAYCPGATIPFYISNSRNPVTIANDWVTLTGAIYVSGLEYINNKYLVGGKYMCLTTSTQNTCATNVNNCVLAKLNNTNFNCNTFNTQVMSKYPDIGRCSSSDINCTSQSTVTDPSNNILSIYQCDASTSNPYKCYSYNDPSGDETSPLCSPSLDPSKRVTPAYPISGDPRLTANQYYNPDINSTTIQNAVSSGAQSSGPVVQDCSSYLNRVVDLTNPTITPYVGIPQCATIDPSTAGNATPLCTGSTTVVGVQPNPFPGYMCYSSSLQLPVCSTSAPLIETFVSTLSGTPSTTQQLDIHNCVGSTIDPVTGINKQQNSYCYNPTPVPTTTTTCQINSAAVTRTTANGNPAVGSSTLDCGSFITLFGNSNSVSLISSSPYSGITACATPPSGSIITTLTSTSSPALAVDLYQYTTITPPSSTLPMLAPPIKQANYCYNPQTTPSGSCTLNRTNTTASRPAQLDCYTLLTLIDANYQNIVPCATPPATCASSAVLDAYAKQNYASSTGCTSTIDTAQCTVEATVSSASTGQRVAVKNCTYDTTITLNYPSGEADPTTTPQSYYCYSYNGDSATSLPACNLGTTDVTITPATTPAPSALSTQLPALTIPDVITNINGGGSSTPAPATTTTVTTGVRSKTSLEQGLCVDVPELTPCAAITQGDSTTGHATWDAANVGAQSIGHCIDGYFPPNGTLGGRTCIINPENATSSFTPLPALSAVTTDTSCSPWSASVHYTASNGTSPYLSTTWNPAGYFEASIIAKLSGGNNQNMSTLGVINSTIGDLSLQNLMVITVNTWIGSSNGFLTTTALTANAGNFFVINNCVLVSDASSSGWTKGTVVQKSACPTSISTGAGCVGYDISQCLKTGANIVYQPPVATSPAPTAPMQFFLAPNGYATP